MTRGQVQEDRDQEAPKETMWQGKYVRAIKQGRWEYVSRTNNIRAVVILAEHEGRLILVEQFRFPIGARCLELPAGLVGDEDHQADIEETALKELEEETGFTADRIERLGDFFASPGLLTESFTLVRAHGVTRIGAGGGTGGEDIDVHLVSRADLPAFVDMKRREGVGIDVKLLMLMPF
ncbi:MAG TPA: NUDIX hydrolase [Sphingomicrobium sp.]|nr:NUDIX hydrolase [Sphingomicrobium sp.]